MGISFSEVLHPEEVLGRRGNPEHIFLYKQLHAGLEKHDHGYLVPIRYKALDLTMALHGVLTKKFVDERPPVYRLGKDFASVLAGVTADIPIDRLPERFFGYISCPAGVLLDEDNNPFHGSYVFIGDGGEIGGENASKKMFFASTIFGEDTFQHTHFKLGGSFDEVFKNLPRESDVSYSAVLKRLNINRLLVNTILYIHSQGPDIEHMRPAASLSHGERKKLKQEQNINLCTVPIKAINWGYTRQQHVKETWISEHPRWQRCGPKFSEIKLILVTGHPRHYKGAVKTLHS